MNVVNYSFQMGLYYILPADPKKRIGFYEKNSYSALLKRIFFLIKM